MTLARRFTESSILLISLLIVAPAAAQNVLPSTDDASAAPGATTAWATHTWAGRARFAVVDGGRGGGKCLMVESEAGADVSWFHRLRVEPNRVYMLTGWIKTENVVATTGRGVVVNVHTIGDGSRPLTGTNDWTRVQTLVRVGNERQIQVNGTFGAWGLASGRAWFDDLTLEPVDLSNFPVDVTIDGGRTGPTINPFIYGQFIEHLGRCIYGGIWAEMLEDRKFYFPITDEYRPYRELLDSKFPVVGASPWEVLGPGGSVTMVKEVPFVGDQTPRVAAGSGIRHNDLGLVAGKNYVGYIWLRAPEGTPRVEIALVSGDGTDDRKSTRVTGIGPAYKKFPFQLAAHSSTDKGRLEIRVEGGSVMIGTVSLMPEDNVRGMRRDTLALLKQLNGTMYRWPGGNFVSGYDWRDGLGDRDRRPPRKNPAWTGVEHNDFGLDEFIDFCREVGAEPVIAANTGLGDDYSAAQEVDYANGSADTIGGTMRVKNGHAEPYNVKYWCVGNEMFGNWQLGFMAIGHYTEKHNRVARAMLKADPTLQLIGVGDLGTPANAGNRQRSWSQAMLEESGNSMHLISEHFYIWNRVDNVQRHVAQMVDAIRDKAERHRRLQPRLENLRGRTIPIAMDEWNYWFTQQYEYGELGCVYQLRDAIGVAAGLHEYYRNSDIISMAHYAQTVNVIGCIKTTKTDAFFDATALPLLLYRREYGTAPLAVTTSHRDLLAIDVAAARTADGRALTIGAVNPNGEPQKLRLKLTGLAVGRQAKVWRIAGDNPQVFNTADSEPITIREEPSVPFGDELTIPPYSVNLYRVPLE